MSNTSTKNKKLNTKSFEPFRRMCAIDISTNHYQLAGGPEKTADNDKASFRGKKRERAAKPY
jgi:hypothetical protein